MPRLRRLSAREICEILEENGFAEVRRRGSQIVMQKRIPDGSLSVPVPDHREVAVGTLRAIIRQS